MMPDHPLRHLLANELHARPFPTATAPGWAAFVAFKPLHDAASRDREAERAHLLALLDRVGAPHPPPGASHWYGDVGRHRLKWESHTEFATYTLIGRGAIEEADESRPETLSGGAFGQAAFDPLPDEWLASAPGACLTSVVIRIESAPDDKGIAARARNWMVAESLVLSRVLGDELVVAGDFRIEPAGHMRFALFVRPDVGEGRIGRVVQRLCEIETYKSMAMLGLQRARELAPEMAALDRRLLDLMGGMAGPEQAERSLDALLDTAADLDALVARSSFRLSATEAYEALVAQRIEALREERFEGHQTLAEFMARRFDPAMRTTSSTARRLLAMAERARRAGDLLRTRVDVESRAQNQRLLASMDRRADLALRLQHTVEGLSVVAVSYYAVGLALHLAAPLAETVGKDWLGTALTPVVVLAVWLILRRIRRGLE